MPVFWRYLPQPAGFLSFESHQKSTKTMVPKKLCLQDSDASVPMSCKPEVWLRRHDNRPPWPRPRGCAASGDFEAAEVAAPRPGQRKRLGFVGRLGEEHGVGTSPAAPHARHGPVGRLAQGQVFAESRSHRDRSHGWPGSIGQRHLAKTTPSLKHGRVWWAEILGRNEGLEGAGSGQPESRRWSSSDGRMVNDRTRWPLRDTGGVCQGRLSPAVRTLRSDGVEVAVQMGETALSGRLQDFTVQPGARPSEALRGLRKVGHPQGCRVRPHRAPLAGDPLWGWSHYFHGPVAFEQSAERPGLCQEQRHESGGAAWQLQDFGPDWKSTCQLRRWCHGEGHQRHRVHRSAERHVCQSEWRFAVDWATCCYHTMCSVLVFVVTAVPSCAESSNRNHWSENFWIGSERTICKFVNRISDDQGRCATRFSFGFLKNSDCARFMCSSVRVICPKCSWDTCVIKGRGSHGL